MAALYSKCTGPPRGGSPAPSEKQRCHNLQMQFCCIYTGQYIIRRRFSNKGFVGSGANLLSLFTDGRKAE
jgi:hypothetical protein